MPFYDRICPQGHLKIDSFERIDAPALPCAECGAPTERAWLPKSTAAVHGDDIPGGFVFEHIVPGHKVYSQTEKRRFLEKHGYREHVEHKTAQGTDKSRHTTRWY